MPRRYALFLVIFLVFTAVRALPNAPAIEKPRQRSDTALYIEISKRSLLSAEFWAGERPPTYPLYLKLADRSLYLASAFQLTFSILSWGALALVIASFLRSPALQVAAFAWTLLLSLVTHLAGWDFTILSESLSITLFVLFTALGLWLMKDWQVWKAAVLVMLGLFLALTRDTNAYLLVVLAVYLLIAALLGWAGKRALVLAGLFAAILFLGEASANGGGRWVAPLLNILGRRVLTAPRSVNIIQKVCDMPVSPVLMGYRNEFANGQVQGFYSDPELEDFRGWLLEEGKSCYPRLLVSDPLPGLSQPIEQFNDLAAFRRVRSFMANDYDPLLPSSLETLLYPTRWAVTLWVFLTLAAVLALILEAWRYNPLWSGFLLLCLTTFPHLYLTWHGALMDLERHALTVALQLVLSGWMLVFLVADLLLMRREEG